MSGEIVRGKIDHEFQVVRRLGQNGGGMNQGIAIVKRKRDRRVFVRKIFCQTENRMPSRRDWLRKMKLLRRLVHCSICAFVERSITSTVDRLYMKFCDFENLSGFRNNMNQLRMVVSESFAWHVLRSLIRALCHMHLRFQNSDETIHSRYNAKSDWLCILHRDLKFKNVFLRSDSSDVYSEIKLRNFELIISIDELDAETAREENELQMCHVEISDWMTSKFSHCNERSDIFDVEAVIQFLCKRSSWREADSNANVSWEYSQSFHDIVETVMTRQREIRLYVKWLVRLIQNRLSQLNLLYKSVSFQTYTRLLN